MSDYTAAVRSWSEHLRAGGTTPWSAWTTAGAAGRSTGDVPAGWSVPGAAQLELVRRLAERSSLDPAAWSRLADLVATRSGPGRGRAQQPLVWTGGSGAPRFGAPPVDPSHVPVEELVRVGVGVLTELLLERSGPPVPATELRRRRLTRTPAFALVGAPITTSVVRRELGVAGHAEGGRRPLVVLLAEPLDVALAQVWSARVQRGAPVRWGGFVKRWSGRRHLPPSADYRRLAREAARGAGADRVHVVVAAADPAATVAELLGVHLGGRRHPALAARWKDLSPAALDVARQVNAVLNVRAGGPRRRTAVGACAALLESVDGPAPRLAVPEPFQGWVADRAGRLAEELKAGGYPVHGDLERVVPRPEILPRAPRRDDVLRVLVDALLRQAGPPRSPGGRSSRG